MNTSPMDRGVSRSTSQALEPVHSMIYFVPEAQEEYAALGLNVKGNRAVGYFPARAAAMGAVSWPVVQATFFNFSPLAVQFGMAGVWDVVSPQQLIDARYRGVDKALTRLCGDLLQGVDEAVGLAPTATEGCTPYGVRSTPRTPGCRGRSSRTCSCGTPSRCCGSSAGTATSPPW